MLRHQFVRLTALGIIAVLGHGCSEHSSSEEPAAAAELQALSCPASYEAENMVKTTGGSTQGGWNLWSNGSVSTQHEFGAGNNSLTVIAKGEQYQGAPTMIVSVDGQVVGTADVSATSWASFTFSYSATSPGIRDVKISFTNDKKGTDGDRNLHIDKIQLTCSGNTGGTGGAASSASGGTTGAGAAASTCVAATYEAEAMTKTTGGGTTGGWNLWSPGSLSANHGFVAGKNTVSVLAKGDQYQGAPRMIVSVGGVEIGSVDVPVTAWTAYKFTYNASSPGVRELRIAFPNDLKGTDGDRNLHVDRVTVSCDQSAGSGGSVSAPATGGAPATGFVHPGILMNKPMLDFVKGKVGTGANLWSAALAKAKSHSRGSLSYTPHPVSDVQCGYYSNPDIGCSDELYDSEAAYTHALIWYFTGDTRYAEKSAQIMNAWSAKITKHSNANAPLQAAWVGQVFPRAAEILETGYAGWTSAHRTQFASMLRNAYLPNLIGGSGNNGNWELSMIDAMLNIAVYTNDRATFDKAIAMWRKRVPAYIYLKTDGATPVPPPTGSKTGSALTEFWYGQTQLVDGHMQETCRDLAHSQMGMSVLLYTAETARIQGVDLFTGEARRITAGLEFHANYLLGASVPSWLCGGKLNTVTPYPMWDLAANVYGTVLGYPMTKTKQLALSRRPSGIDKHMVWETLTHADLGTAGWK